MKHEYWEKQLFVASNIQMFFHRFLKMFWEFESLMSFGKFNCSRCNVHIMKVICTVQFINIQSVFIWVWNLRLVFPLFKWKYKYKLQGQLVCCALSYAMWCVTQACLSHAGDTQIQPCNPPLCFSWKKNGFQTFFFNQ